MRATTKHAIARPVTYVEHEAGGLHRNDELHRHDNGKFTSIRDVASTSQTRTQWPFGDGWRKINVPTLDYARDEDPTMLCTSAKLRKRGTLKPYKGFLYGMPTIEVETINADLTTKCQRNGGTGASAPTPQCEHLSIHPRARRIWREGITKK